MVLIQEFVFQYYVCTGNGLLKNINFLKIFGEKRILVIMSDDPSSIMSDKLSTPRNNIAGKNTDDINRQNSYGENNHQNSSPHLYGENNHLQNSSYHGDTNHRNIYQRNYNHTS